MIVHDTWNFDSVFMNLFFNWTHKNHIFMKSTWKLQIITGIIISIIHWLNRKEKFKLILKVIKITLNNLSPTKFNSAKRSGQVYIFNGIIDNYYNYN